MKLSLFLSLALLVLGWAAPVSSAQVAPASYRSDAMVDALKNWIANAFIHEPLIFVLPDTIAQPAGNQWFTEQDVLTNETLLQNPSLMARAVNSIQAAHKEQAQRVEAARLNFLTVGNQSAVNFEQGRPLIFMNPPQGLPAHDLESAVAARDAPVRIGADVLRLVDNRLFSEKLGVAPTIPTSMEVFVNTEFALLKSVLPNNAAKLIAPCRIDIATPPGEKLLWLGSDQRPEHKRKECPFLITISPLLARAIFVRSIGSRPYEALQQLNGPYGQRTELADLLLKQFAMQLHFVLAHELGHLFYTRLSQFLTLEDEACIDQEAYVLTGSLDHHVEFGAFRTILEAAIAQHHEELWSMEQSAKAGDIEIRASRLRNLREPALSPACRQNFDFKHLIL